MHALALARLGKIGACEAALDKALAAARRARDRRRANAVLAGAPLAALWGPSPVTRASGRCLDVVRVLRITQGAPAVEAVALRCQAVLEALRGRTDAARRMIASSRRLVEELGITQRLLEADVFAGLIELLEGDAVAAERCLRAAYDGLRDHGLGIDAAQAAALLGRALLAQGRAAEAEALSHESEALAGDDFKAAISLARRARRGAGAARRARGGHRSSRAPRSRSPPRPMSCSITPTRGIALAAALRAAGRGAEADTERARAIELWEAKGATLLVERAQREAGSGVRREPQPEVSAESRASVPRRVRANGATAYVARLQAAISARDAAALPGLIAADIATIHRPTGLVSYDRKIPIDFWNELLRARDPTLATEILASLGDSLALVRQSFSVSGLAEGDSPDVGPVVKEEVSLIEVDASGRASRLEIHAPEHLGDAIVRLYERYAERLPDGSARASAATAARSAEAMLGPPQIDRLAEAFALAIEASDARSLGTWAARGSEAALQHFRSLLEVADDIAMREYEILRLEEDALLVRRTHCGTDRTSGGAYERRFLMLLVFGADGRITRIQWFDPDRDADALARFDELTAERSAKTASRVSDELQRSREQRDGDAIVAPHARGHRVENAATRFWDRGWELWEQRDWDQITALYPAGFRNIDRQRMMQIEVDRDRFFDTGRPLFEMFDAPPSKRVLATRGERLALAHFHWEGSSELVGPTEFEWLDLLELDAGGEPALLVTFDPDAREAAWAELDARHRAGEAAPYARVSAGMQEFKRAFTERDWDALAARCAPDLVVHDHRLLGWETLHGPAAYLEALRSLVDLAPDTQLRIDHASICESGYLVVTVWEGTREGGAYEAPSLMVAELDAQSLVRRFDQYDLERLAHASARFDSVRAGAEGDPLAGLMKPNAATAAMDRLQAAFAARDWAGLRSVLATDAKIEDRRRLALISGDAEWAVTDMQRIAEEAPDVQLTRKLVAAHGDRLALERFLWRGGPAGGRFEVEYFGLSEVDEAGRIASLIAFDLDAESAARNEARARSIAGADASPARFEPLRPNPLRIPPNAAARALDRWQKHTEARDLEAVAELLAPSFAFEDRRRLVRDSGDREKMLASVRVAITSGASLSQTLLATAGDRLALVHQNFALFDGARRLSEIETLLVAEVDAEGRVVATVGFDPDDRRGAGSEMFERLAQGDAAPSAWMTWWRMIGRALLAHDLASVRAALPADYVFHDRRRTGAGRLEGADTYVGWLAALYEQSPDAVIEPLYFAAVETHGTLAVGHTFGTLAAGGAFENVFVQLLCSGENLIVELFELDDLEPARARFAELRPDPLRIPANAATRACDRWLECIVAADWDALRALCAPIVFEDRRRLNRTSGAYDMILTSSQVIAKLGGRAVRSVLATSGDRLSLERVLWTADDAGAVSEVETLQITEVDAAGHVVAAIVFEPDDRRSAFDELQGRFAAGEAAATGGQAPVVALVQAFTRHDWDALRVCLADDAVVHDHRKLGVMGALSGDDWIESRRVLADLAPDVGEETLRILAWNRRGRVSVGRLFGVARDAGPFEILFIGVYLTGADRVDRYEFFDVGDADRAVARFEALCAGPG